MLKKIRNFLENSSGSILPTMAILTVPLAITAGAAIDYSRYVNMRSEIQVGIDAAAIATVAAIPEIEQSIPSNITGEAYKARLEEELSEYAGNFLETNITSPVAKNGYTISFEYVPPSANVDSSVTITADIEYDTIFGGMDGKDGGILLFSDKLNDQITSLVTTGNRTIEVALVVDNSGSMAFKAGNLTSFQFPAPVSQRRITKLQSAAKALVSDLFDAGRASQLPDPVQFSIVPFSTTVNVGNTDHINHRQGNRFLDVRGYASYHNENLDWANTYRTEPGDRVVLRANRRAARLIRANGSRQFLTRLDVFEMLGTEWEGCVEMRPYPHNIQDTYQANNSGYNANNSEKLFVPYFVPDAPDEEVFDFYSDSANRFVTIDDNPPTGTNRYDSNYIPDFYDYDPDRELAEPIFIRDNLFNSTVTADDYDANQISRTNWVHKYQAYQGLDQNNINALPTNNTRDRQLRNILNDLDTPRFEKNLNSNGVAYYGDSGPNAFCPDTTVLQLTDDVNEINSTIDSMEAHGGTNIQQGLTWGWRTLSSARPFITGRDLSDVENRKILILLTDGANQLIPENTSNNTRYSAWGYQRTDNVLKHATTGLNSHGRLLEGADDIAGTIYDTGGFSLANNPTTQADYEDLMNLHTNQACNNIKNDGVTIYTIAFDVPEGSKVKSLLENCAGSGKINGSEVVRGVQFYHDVIGLALEDTFAEIASSISAIRISK